MKDDFVSFGVYMWVREMASQINKLADWPIQHHKAAGTLLFIVISEQAHLEYSVQMMTKILIDNYYKLILGKSELSALPAWCISKL